MMRQAIDIRDATDPDEILFVVDAMIGQDAVTTAQAFLDGVGYDGVVLTKLDGDARGGAALSIAQLTGRPVMFASSGEKLEDFDLFHPDRMASRILDLGDLLTLIEQAERTFDSEQAATMAGKLVSGDGFTLEDFIEQLAMVRKLGPIGNLLGMLPGAAQNREALSQISDKDLDRAAAIVNSMTPEERRTPKMINGSRRARVAAGAGVTVGEVNNLVIRFLEGQKMMRQMMGGMGLPGMRRGGQKSRAKGKKKGKGGGRPAGAGNRAKTGQGTARAAQDAAAGAAGDLAPDAADAAAALSALRQGGPAAIPGLSGGLPGGLPGNLGAGPGADGKFRLPAGPGGPGFPPPGQSKLPPGLRRSASNRRGRSGGKGK